MRLMLAVAVWSILLLAPDQAGAQQLRTKVSPESAQSAALARVPNGSVQAMQLKVERGTLVYIYDISAPGGSGLEEVQVSAVDGRVVSVQHLGGAPDHAATPGQRVADRVNGPAPPQR
jgi:hypothetical protein